MAARARSRARASRSQVGAYVLAAAGLVLLIGFLAPFANLPIDSLWIGVLFHAGMAIGFGLLAATMVGSERGAAAVAAAGWAVRLISFFVPLGILVDIANLAAVFGGLVAALLLTAGRSRGGAGALVIAMLLVVAFVYPMLIAFAPLVVLQAISPLLGVALVVAGILLPRR
ncbi:hypothetical protein [Naasia aerilata]|uniref:Uncharacterized protein n=1 Tax=Naasia aerilata TaxID=1162966 RepID=A0ABN6XQ90_9MICO|nr:hypothetical protein [Naasia aerilata]BDZ47152.1 hypothetical protein GCM10025866_30610 [Naasia aerilata]